MVQSANTPISDLEKELIAFFVNASQSIGLPKSYGEIYGLYFVSDDPLALDHVIEKLQISKGSASQGIRFLKSINALNPSYVPGDRRDYYSPELSLRRIADGLIRERISPELNDSTERLKVIKSQYPEQESTRLIEKINYIESWSKKANMLIPFVSKFLGSKSRLIKT